MTIHDLPSILFGLTALAWAVSGIIKARNGGNASNDVVMCCMFVSISMLFFVLEETRPEAAPKAATTDHTASAR